MLAGAGLLLSLSGIIETPLLHPSTQPNTQTRNNTRFKPSKPNSATTIAIALKSGVETFNARVDSQLDSFLDKKGGVHVVLVGDKEAVSTGGHTMVDVYTGEFERAKKRVEESGKSVVIQTGEGMSNRLVNATTLKANTKAKRMEQGHNSNDTSTSGWFDSDGWRADAHKNLPGFRLLFEKFPDADFFMMIDDDTYVFLDNLQRYLSRYDSSKKLYFGQANRFRGCDGVMEYDDSLKAPLVAQGGAGIIMSRGALAAMLKVVDECIVKYNGCWAGDIRVALCLRDVDIRLQHLVGLNGWPPQGNFIFSPNPCEVPFTYHHVLPEQMKQIHEIEQSFQKQHPNRALPSAHMYHAFQKPSLNPQDRDDTIRDKDIERVGRAFMNFNTATFEECERRCIYYSQCVSWFHDARKRCWLKKSPGGKEKVEGVWSGVLPNRFACEEKPWWRIF
ncbi:hypothetical protein HDU77_009024 [Chytriomyces hyalinus]|nr:hypothetical protein HDU77_009024 [Chytriomyces hyalinus]